jgi:hypothetical protein
MEWWSKRVAGQSWRVDGSTRVEARWSQDCEKAMAVKGSATGGRRKVKGVNPDSDHPIYRGVH